MASLSIIIPVYNDADYLEYSVLSALNQPCADLEVIIVDDGSTDYTRDKAEKLCKKHDNITLLYQENHGVSSARNRGIDYCIEKKTSDYIMFLDADDLLIKNFYTDKLRDKVLSDDTDLHSFSFIKSTADLSKGTLITNRQHQMKLCRFMPGMHISSYIYKVRMLDQYKIRFPEHIRIDENIPFNFISGIVANSCTFHNRCDFVERIRPGSVMYQEGVVGEASKTMNPLYLYLKNGIPAHQYTVSEINRIRNNYQVNNSSWISDIIYCEKNIQGLIITAIRHACLNNVNASEIISALEEAGLKQYFNTNRPIPAPPAYQAIWNLFQKDPDAFSKNISQDQLIRNFVDNICNKGSQEYMHCHYELDLNHIDVL